MKMTVEHLLKSLRNRLDQHPESGCAEIMFADEDGKPHPIKGGIFTVSSRHGNVLLLSPIRLDMSGGF